MTQSSSHVREWLDIRNNSVFKNPASSFYNSSKVKNFLIAVRSSAGFKYGPKHVVPILGSHQHVYSVILRNDRVIEQSTCAVEKSMFVNRGKLFHSLPRNLIRNFRIVYGSNVDLKTHLVGFGSCYTNLYSSPYGYMVDTGHNHRLTYVSGWTSDTTLYSYGFLLIAAETRLKGNYASLVSSHSCITISFHARYHN